MSNQVSKGMGGAPNRASIIPEDPKERKTFPIATGLCDYFPDALAMVAHLSFVANEQHNPGQPVHWARSKSTDEADTLMRHFLQRGALDKDGIPHTAKVAWRALAMLQKELEAARTVDSFAAFIENQNMGVQFLNLLQQDDPHWKKHWETCHEQLMEVCKKLISLADQCFNEDKVLWVKGY